MTGGTMLVIIDLMGDDEVIVTNEPVLEAKEERSYPQQLPEEEALQIVEVSHERVKHR